MGAFFTWLCWSCVPEKCKAPSYFWNDIGGAPDACERCGKDVPFSGRVGDQKLWPCTPIDLGIPVPADALAPPSTGGSLYAVVRAHEITVAPEDDEES